MIIEQRMFARADYSELSFIEKKVLQRKRSKAAKELKGIRKRIEKSPLKDGVRLGTLDGLEFMRYKMGLRKEAIQEVAKKTKALKKGALIATVPVAVGIAAGLVKGKKDKDSAAPEKYEKDFSKKGCKGDEKA